MDGLVRPGIEADISCDLILAHLASHDSRVGATVLVGMGWGWGCAETRPSGRSLTLSCLGGGCCRRTRKRCGGGIPTPSCPSWAGRAAASASASRCRSPAVGVAAGLLGVFRSRQLPFALGSGPRYQILSHVFARCASQKTYGHARIARDHISCTHFHISMQVGLLCCHKCYFSYTRLRVISFYDSLAMRSVSVFVLGLIVTQTCVSAELLWCWQTTAAFVGTMEPCCLCVRCVSLNLYHSYLLPPLLLP